MQVLLGIFLTFISGTIIYQEISKRLKCKEITKGTVVDFFERTKIKKGREKIVRYPIFEYIANGNTVRKRYNIKSKIHPYQLSDEVNIHYNKNKEDEFYIKGDGDSLILGVIILIMGLMLLLL